MCTEDEQRLKECLIREIQKLVPGASSNFLSPFDLKALKEYLEQIQSLGKSALEIRKKQVVNVSDFVEIDPE